MSGSWNLENDATNGYHGQRDKNELGSLWWQAEREVADIFVTSYEGVTKKVLTWNLGYILVYILS